MRTLGVLAVCVWALLGGLALAAQDGVLDTGFDPGDGANGVVHSVVIQPDGKILIGGNFTTIDGITRNRVARLHPDGSLDTTFDPRDGASHVVRAIALQPDGKILIAGLFTEMDGEWRSHVARLHPDGHLDTSFDPDWINGGTVHAVALQPDGKILVGGEFTHVGVAMRRNVARLNTDGSLDQSFNARLGDPYALHPIHAILVEAGEKIWIAGGFSSFSEIGHHFLRRLHPDGTLDLQFGEIKWAGGIYAASLQPDGKVLAGGMFSFEGAASAISRFNPDGTLDANFDTGGGVDDTIRTIALQPDGKILIGGDFTQVDGVERNRIARLHPDGSLDTTFDPAGGANNPVRAITPQPDGKILIGGGFTTVDGEYRRRIARLDYAAPLITSLPETTAAATQTWTYTVAASGKPAPTISVADLSDWLFFDGVDTISGVPQEVHIEQTFGPITVTAVNDWGETTQTFTIDVVGIAAQFTTAPVTTATIGFSYEYLADATGVPAPILSADGLPEWLMFNPATGELSGTPPGSAVGTTADITITASGWGDPALQSFGITVGSSFFGGGGAGGCAANGGMGLWAAGLLILLAPALRRRRSRARP